MQDRVVSKKITVRGRVQGVSYRLSTEKEALRIGGLSGWVKNLSNGDVELFVQGESSHVNALIRWCHRGPSHAVVESVSEEEVLFDSEIRGFSIR